MTPSLRRVRRVALLDRRCIVLRKYPGKGPANTDAQCISQKSGGIQ